MVKKNKFKIDEKTIVRMIFEQELWGSERARAFWIVAAVLLIISLIGMISNIKNIFMMLLVLLLIVINVIRIFCACDKARKSYKDKVYDFTITISDGKFVQEAQKDGEITHEEEFNTSDIKYLCSVKNYSFLYFNNRKLLVFDNRSFENGSLSDIRRLLPDNDKKTDNTANEYSGDPFKIVKVAVLIGTILSALMGVLFVNNTPTNGDELKIIVLMTISGILFSTIIGFGIIYYVRWFRKQGILLRVLSILFYPISFAIFFWVGLVCMVPYSVNGFKNRKKA